MQDIYVKKQFMLRVELISIPPSFPMMLDPIQTPISIPINPVMIHLNIFLANSTGINFLIAFSACRCFTNTGFNQNPPQLVLL
jgi:hypothetical protein